MDEKILDQLTPELIEQIIKLGNILSQKVESTKSEGPPVKRARKKQSKKDSDKINKFEQSDIFNAYREDSKIDKKLWGNRKPSERTARKAQKITVKCMTCDTECEVDRSEVYFMSRNEYSFTCNKCLRGKRK